MLNEKMYALIDKDDFIIGKIKTNSKLQKSDDFNYIEIGQEDFDKIPNETSCYGVNFCKWNNGIPTIEEDIKNKREFEIRKKQKEGEIKSDLFNRVINPKQNETIDDIRTEYLNKIQAIQIAKTEEELNGI